MSFVAPNAATGLPAKAAQAAAVAADGARATPRPNSEGRRISVVPPTLEAGLQAPGAFVQTIASRASDLLAAYGLAEQKYRTGLHQLLALSATSERSLAAWTLCYDLYLSAAAAADKPGRPRDCSLWLGVKDGQTFFNDLTKLINDTDDASLLAFCAMANAMPWPELSPTQRVLAHQLLGLVPANARSATFERLQRSYGGSLRPSCPALIDDLSYANEPLLHVQYAVHQAYSQAIADRVLGRVPQADELPPFVVQELTHLLPDKSTRRKFQEELAKAPEDFDIDFLRTVNAYLPRLGVTKVGRVQLINTVLQLTSYPQLVFIDLAERLLSLLHSDATATNGLINKFLCSLLIKMNLENHKLFERLWTLLFGDPALTEDTATDYTVERCARALTGAITACADKVDATAALRTLNTYCSAKKPRQMLARLEQLGPVPRRDLAALATDVDHQAFLSRKYPIISASQLPPVLRDVAQEQAGFEASAKCQSELGVRLQLEHLVDAASAACRRAAFTSDHGSTWEVRLAASPTACDNLLSFCAAVPHLRMPNAQRLPPAANLHVWPDRDPQLEQSLALTWRRLRKFADEPILAAKSPKSHCITLFVRQLEAMQPSLLDGLQAWFDLQANLANVWCRAARTNAVATERSKAKLVRTPTGPHGPATIG